MRIMVNHLTRMQPPYMCVAGIDMASGQHIRPVQGKLTTSLLARNGGPFDMASLVELGLADYCGYPPEVEDHLFEASKAYAVDVVSATDFWKCLQQVARKSLVEIFGPALKAFRNGCVVDLGTGEASLGCLIPTGRPTLYVNDYGKIRAVVTDGTFKAHLSVTDIRFYEEDHTTPSRAIIEQTASCMRSGSKVILGVGLTRPWPHPDDTTERHWLQVTNIHLEDDAGWQLG